MATYRDLVIAKLNAGICCTASLILIEHKGPTRKDAPSFCTLCGLDVWEKDYYSCAAHHAQNNKEVVCISCYDIFSERSKSDKAAAAVVHAAITATATATSPSKGSGSAAAPTTTATSPSDEKTTVVAPTPAKPFPKSWLAQQLKVHLNDTTG